MALSYDFPCRLIVTIANFLFLGCFLTKKNSYSCSHGEEEVDEREDTVVGTSDCCGLG